MSVTTQNNNLAYGIRNALQALSPRPIVSNRSPGTSDRADIGTLWVNKPSSLVFICAGTINNSTTWLLSAGSGSETLTSLTVNPGDVTITAGNLNVTAGNATFGAGNVTLTAGTLTTVGLVATGNAISIAGSAPTAGRTTTINGGVISTFNDTLNLSSGGMNVTTAVSRIDNVNIANGAITSNNAGATVSNFVRIGSGVLTGTNGDVNNSISIGSGDATSTGGSVNSSVVIAAGDLTGGGSSSSLVVGNIAGTTQIELRGITGINTNANANTSINNGTSTGTVTIGGASTGAMALRSNVSITITAPASTNVSIPNGVSVSAAGRGVSLPGGLLVLSGTGSPDTVVTAPAGSLYLRSDPAGATSRAYINTNSATAWTNVTCAA